MSDKFVIVIEADNRRALAAYQKGLADLDLIWPQLEASAERADEKRRIQYETEIAQGKAEQERRDVIINQHYEDLKQWRNSIFRGPEPTAPPEYYLPRLPSVYTVAYYRPNRSTRSLRSIRAELQKMANIAGAAIGPYRMTEYQVQEMVSWEDGSRIERLKRDMLDDETVADIGEHIPIVE